MTIGCCWPRSSRYVAPSGTEYLVPSLKMLPTSMTRSIRSGLPQVGHPSPARATCRSAQSHAKSWPGVTPVRWNPSRLAPTT